MHNFRGISVHWGNRSWNCTLKIFLDGPGVVRRPSFAEKIERKGPGFDSARGPPVRHILSDIDDGEDDEDAKDGEDNEDENDEKYDKHNFDDDTGYG